jgi:uncharacterized protein YhfF
MAELIDRVRASGFTFPPGKNVRLEWFGRDAQLVNELGDLVRAGVKGASAGLVADWEAVGDPIPELGDIEIIVDWNGEPVAVVEVTEVRHIPFGDVDAAFAWDEGEGDRTLAWWRAAHRRFFTPICERLGIALDESTPLVCRRFRLLHAVSVTA